MTHLVSGFSQGWFQNRLVRVPKLMAQVMKFLFPQTAGAEQGKIVEESLRSK